MYLYAIENNDSKEMRVSRDKYDIYDLFPLYQKPVLVRVNANGEQIPGPFPQDVSGTIVDRKLLREGLTIDGVTVVKIHEDEVEFEKDGHRWTQKEGDEAGPPWR